MSTHNKTTCRKVFADLPFAHRQHNHSGHCAMIHGHNWSFAITFAAASLDANEFVVDFGKLKWLRAWLEEKFDHTLLLNDTDPHLDTLKEKLLRPSNPEKNTDEKGLPWIDFAKIVTVPNCGAEGLARYVLETINAEFFETRDIHRLQDLFLEYRIAKNVTDDWAARGVHVSKVEVFEDSRNSATYEL